MWSLAERQRVSRTVNKMELGKETGAKFSQAP